MYIRLSIIVFSKNHSNYFGGSTVQKISAINSMKSESVTKVMEQVTREGIYFNYITSMIN